MSMLRYFNEDGSSKVFEHSAAVGGKQDYSIFGWQASNGQGKSAKETMRVRMKVPTPSPDKCAGSPTNQNTDSPRHRPGSAKRIQEIVGHDIFADGVAERAPSSPRHAANKQHEMHGELQGSGIGFIEAAGSLRPASGRKAAFRPAESQVFSSETLPVRAVSLQKQAHLQGTMGFKDVPQDLTPWKAAPSELQVPWDNTKKVDGPKVYKGYGTRTHVGGRDQVVLG